LQREPGSSISTPFPIPPPQGGRGEPVAWLAPKFGVAFAALADLILPPVCISCSARVGAHGLLCGACFARIDFIAPPICARLGVPLPYEAGEATLSAAAIAGLQSTTGRAPPLAIPRPCGRSSRASNMGTGTRGLSLSPLARQGGRGASRRRRPHRAGARSIPRGSGGGASTSRPCSRARWRVSLASQPNASR
jgi:hypothetical protein